MSGTFKRLFPITRNVKCQVTLFRHCHSNSTGGIATVTISCGFCYVKHGSGILRQSVFSISRYFLRFLRIFLRLQAATLLSGLIDVLYTIESAFATWIPIAADRQKWSISFWRKQTWATSVHPSRKSDRLLNNNASINPVGRCNTKKEFLNISKLIIANRQCCLALLPHPDRSVSLSAPIRERWRLDLADRIFCSNFYQEKKAKMNAVLANYGNWGDAVVKRNSLSKNIKFYLNWISASIRANIECPRNAIAPTHFHSALGQTRNEPHAYIGRARSPLWVTITPYRDIERVSRAYTRVQNPSIYPSTCASIRVIPAPYRCRF